MTSESPVDPHVVVEPDRGRAMRSSHDWRPGTADGELRSAEQGAANGRWLGPRLPSCTGDWRTTRVQLVRTSQASLGESAGAKPAVGQKIGWLPLLGQ